LYTEAKITLYLRGSDSGVLQKVLQSVLQYFLPVLLTTLHMYTPANCVKYQVWSMYTTCEPARPGLEIA